MFDTSNSNHNPSNHETNEIRPPDRLKRLTFKTVDELSDWLDVQLESLVEKNREFQTSESNRHFFKRK